MRAYHSLVLAGNETGVDAVWRSYDDTAELTLQAGVEHKVLPAGTDDTFASSFVFDGTGGAVSQALDSYSGIDGNQSAAIEMWVKFDSLTGQQTLLDSGS